MKVRCGKREKEFSDFVIRYKEILVYHTHHLIQIRCDFLESPRLFL